MGVVLRWHGSPPALMCRNLDTAQATNHRFCLYQVIPSEPATVTEYLPDWRKTCPPIGSFLAYFSSIRGRYAHGAAIQASEDIPRTSRATCQPRADAAR